MTGATNASLVEGTKKLIEETADVLERIGDVTEHRKGSSALYGKHLREIVRNAQIIRPPTSIPPPKRGEGYPPRAENQDRNVQRRSPIEPIQFSSMSDDEVMEAITNAGNQLDTLSSLDFRMEDTGAMEWLDWFDFYGVGQ